MKAIKELADLVEAKEPGILSYTVYFTEDDTRMTIVHLHGDAASLGFRMKVAGPAFPRFAEYIRMISIVIYGDPGDLILGQLRKKGRDARERDRAGPPVPRRICPVRCSFRREIKTIIIYSNI